MNNTIIYYSTLNDIFSVILCEVAAGKSRIPGTLLIAGSAL
jgi:hypothetical protein